MIAKQFKKSLCRRNSHAYTCAFEFEGNVQEVGYRLKAWTIALWHETLQKGRLENVDGNRMRIYLTSRSLQELEHAYNELCRPGNVPENAELVAVRQIDANGVKMLPAQRVTDILMLEQQSKGVDYLKKVLEQLAGTNKGMGGLSKNMEGLGEKIDGLPDRIADKLGAKFDGLPDRISEKLAVKFDELPDRIADKLGRKFDELPDRIADKLGRKFDELPDRISEKLGEKIDALPEKIAKAIKTA